MKAATGVTAFELIIKIALGLVEYNEISENLDFRDSSHVLLPIIKRKRIWELAHKDARADCSVAAHCQVSIGA